MPDKRLHPHKRSLILILDDDDLMEVFYKSLFREHAKEFLVRLSASAQDALERLQTERVDALILNCDSPKLGGLSLLKALRKGPAAKTTRALAVSTDSSVETQIQALESGADDYMAKPFDVQVFIARLRALVRRWS